MAGRKKGDGGKGNGAGNKKGEEAAKGKPNRLPPERVAVGTAGGGLSGACEAFPGNSEIGKIQKQILNI